MKTLIVLVLGEFFISLIPVPGDYAWYTHDVLTHTRLAVLAFLLASYVPYRQLALRCAVTWYALAETLHALAELCWYFTDTYLPYVDGLRVALAMVVLVWYVRRRYDLPSDPLDGRHVFLVYSKPRSVQGWLLAMAGKPVGGLSVYCRGFWYHYKHGVFVKSELGQLSTRLHSHVIIKADSCDDKFITIINDLVGTRWSILHNCMTVLLPVVVLRRRVPWMPTRR